ncbi:spermatogenesis- and oogenesis-specific basic helix-loop-helix-containing protein 1 [Lemur catta]|uniref:spermatogenesis- and oogenesis-specific basic helix-loop-helix-containing protein 1 n=1 Tax=Lemur catta TaxID=9447 RepID=UPI001E26D54B|nr:spermatogenesis- and oogenesis-specific basic helix-loop-helix-containing protein 1 [Lemur catta]
MASQAPEPDAGVPRVLSPGGCSASSSEALSCGEDLAPGSGPATAPPVAEGPSPRLPRNVLSERERRKRISLSCERLRALLPRFHGRREDMASVLETAVQFIRLARTLVPGQEPHAESCERTDLVFAPSKETWHSLQKNVLQLALSCQVPAGTPGLGTEASVVTVLVSPVAHPAGPWDPQGWQTHLPQHVLEWGRPGGLAGSPQPVTCHGPGGGASTLRAQEGWACGGLVSGSSMANSVGRQGDLPRCAALDVAESKAPAGSSEALGRPSRIPEPSSLAPPPAGLAEVPRPLSPWPRSRQLTSPVMSEEAPGWLGHAGPLARAATPLAGPAEEALVPAPDASQLGVGRGRGARLERGLGARVSAFEGLSLLGGLLALRSVSGSDGEDKMSFLLTASPDWWPGSLEGRGSGASAWATPRSSSPDGAEPGLPEDPELGCQELQDSSLEPWGSDFTCSGLALREEEDGIFPDFFAC